VKTTNPEDALLYMETELNSSMATLAPGETYAMDTEWQPTRLSRQLKTVTSAELFRILFLATPSAIGFLLSGEFGVFVSGKLIARPYDRRGIAMEDIPLQAVSPESLVQLRKEIKTRTI